MKDKLFSLRNFLRRLKSESPSYFRKLRALMIWLGGLGAALGVAIKADVEMFASVPFYTQLASHLVVVGLVGTLLASLPVSDNSKAIDP